MANQSQRFSSNCIDCMSRVNEKQHMSLKLRLMKPKTEVPRWL